jgi:hypothetical protein
MKDLLGLLLGALQAKGAEGVGEEGGLADMQVGQLLAQAASGGLPSAAAAEGNGAEAQHQQQ